MQIKTTDKIVMKRISEIKPYTRNPRKNDKTVEALAKIIPIAGFNQPILIDKNNIIVKGHARYTAAIRLGMEFVPCVVSEADEETNRLDRLTDNKISELSDWTDGLSFELDSLDIDLDLSDFGFPELEFNDFEDDFTDEYKEENNQLSVQERYVEMLKQQENAKPVEITSEKAIERAKEQQGKEAKCRKKYAKVVCEKCGHIMFIKEEDCKFEVL